MAEKIGRRGFLGRGLKASAGAALTRVVGSSGTPKAINWVRAIKEMILRDNRIWQKVIKDRGYPSTSFSATPEYIARVSEFIADIQKHVSLDVFVKLRGVGYMTMEYDMWMDAGIEYWDDFARFLEANIQYIQ